MIPSLSSRRTRPATARAPLSCRLEFRDVLSRLEREWLVAQLTARRGVIRAGYDPDDSHGLILEYDSAVASLSDLLDFLYLCGVCAQPLPHPSGRRRRRSASRQGPVSAVPRPGA